jgi:SOS response regulatory protein OraA/RecX
VGAPPVITRLQARGSARVEVELDDRPWRVIPAEAVLVAGLAIGRAVDRTTARTLARELRRLEARGQALRALRARDHTVASLDQRLAERGAAPRVRRETLAAAQRAGLVDDGRVARQRAAVLAERGAGNRMIAADLEHRGVPDEEIRRALTLLEPESDRVARIIEARGRTPGTVRHLAAKGFSEETLEPLIADMSSEAIE